MLNLRDFQTDEDQSARDEQVLIQKINWVNGIVQWTSETQNVGFQICSKFPNKESLFLLSNM